MKNKMDKEDKLVSDIMKEYQMESPSEGFTDRVMMSIEVESSMATIKSTPLISKAGWFGIAASLLILIAYLYFGMDTQASAESGWLTQLFSNLNIPSIKFIAPDFFSRINLNSPTLFWICIGIAGIAVLALLERVLESINARQFLFI